LRHILEKDLSGNAAAVGSYFTGRLLALQEKWKIAKTVRGRGLLLAVEFSEPIALQLVKACRDLGLLVNPLPPHTIRFMPPLIIGRRDVDQAVAILNAALQQVASHS
jgi:acetylornithine/succinyldiaminopimelate/putrescine aminotransferase